MIAGPGIGLLALFLATGAHYLNLAAGLGGVYIDSGRGFPVTPGLRASHADLLTRSLIVSLPMLPVVGLAALLRRALACLAFAALWLLGAETLSALFKPDFGTTWGFGEGLTALYWQPVLSPASLLACTALLWIATARRPR